MRLNAASVVLS